MVLGVRYADRSKVGGERANLFCREGQRRCNNKGGVSLGNWMSERVERCGFSVASALTELT
jgi:hypothetical protein